MPVSWTHRAEFGFLLALCVFLPLYEAPKNLAWLGYAIAWMANRAAARNFGGRWDRWDTLVAAWIASGFVVAAFAGLHGSEWHAALDIVRYAGALWMVKRSRFGEREIELVVIALVASVSIALIMAYAQLSAHPDMRLELNSVGHVNHSAIYLALMLALCASWLYTGRRRVLAAAVSALVVVSLFVAASRAGVAVGLLTLVILAAAWWPRWRVPMAEAVAVLVVAGVVFALGGAEVFERHEAVTHAGNTLAYRDRAWSLAIATWAQHPFFGVGMDNFSIVAREQTTDAYRSLFPHAHNLYLNALAERGVIGAAPLAVVLVAWPLCLIRRRPCPADSDHEWL
ncbi:MAG TPA: O-antigen ligase family protein, partial [Burkholderiales bacterium]|nr:O-antigen ligase family protein [Burkholderiales bacterium]